SKWPTSASSGRRSASWIGAARCSPASTRRARATGSGSIPSATSISPKPGASGSPSTHTSTETPPTERPNEETAMIDMHAHWRPAELADEMRARTAEPRIVKNQDGVEVLKTRMGEEPLATAFDEVNFH